MQDVIDIPGQPTLTAHEYAEKYNISRRTVTRYIKQGKLEAVRRKGRTHVIDLEPSETPIETEHAKKLDSLDSESGQLVRQPDDYVFKLGQLSVQAKAGHRWQFLSIVLVVLLFLATPAAVWLYLTWQDTAGELAISQETTATITADLDTATATIGQLQTDLVNTRTTAAELKADVNATKTINQNLQGTLADTRQQLDAERKRTNDLQAKMADLSMLFSQSTAENASSTAQDATGTP